MRKTNLTSVSCFAFVIMLLGFTFPGPSQQQTYQPEELRAIIENHPDSLEIHKKFIDSAGVDDSELLKQYSKWTKDFPGSAVVPFAIGSAFISTKPDVSKSYLLQAVERDSSFVPAWARLSLHANLLGDFQSAIIYNKKAYEADTTDPDRFFYYASSLSNHQPEKYRKLSLEVAERFPNKERGAQALYWLALRVDGDQERIALYQRLRNDFPPADFRWSKSAMIHYFNLCLEHNLPDALKLAKAIVRQTPDDSEWTIRKTMAENLIKAQNHIDKGNSQKAIEVLQATSTGRYNPNADKTLTLLESEAMYTAGKTEAAYDSLLVYYSQTPSDQIFSALSNYGEKLQKDSADVKNDVFQQFDKIAEPVEPFKFEYYKKPGKYATLSDFDNKVILLTYWYPGCGPCRREFPHFENVVNKFSENELAYVGVNIVPDEDEYVLPFVENSGYSFTPLHDNPDMRGNLTVRGAPTNYLIDPDGRIIFSHFMIGANDERMLELMISNILENHKKN